MRVSILATIVFGAFVGSLWASVPNSPVCILESRLLTRFNEGKAFTPEVLERFHTYFSLLDSAADPERRTAAARTWAEYQNIRLSSLPLPERQEAINAVRNRTMLTHGGASFVGDAAINIRVPNKYRGTIWEYLVLAHELDHFLALRKLQLPSSWDSDQKPSRDERIKIWYLMEHTAMGSEFELLACIPPKEREAFARLVESDEALKADTSFSNEREWLLRALRTKAKNSSEYTTQEKQIGRYSLESISRNIDRVFPVNQ